VEVGNGDNHHFVLIDTVIQAVGKTMQ